MKRSFAILIVAFVLAASFSFLSSGEARASSIYFNKPYVKYHSCGSNPYAYSPDYYMYANGSTNCNTIGIVAADVSGGPYCDFYAMNPDHGSPYKGTSNAYYGTFTSNSNGAFIRGNVIRVVYSPSNSWVYLGRFQASYLEIFTGVHWSTFFEVGDNNGFTGVIGVSQIKQIC